MPTATLTRRAALGALLTAGAGALLARSAEAAPALPAVVVEPPAPRPTVLFARPEYDAELGVWVDVEVADLAAAVAEGVHGRAFVDCGDWWTEIKPCSAAAFVDDFTYTGGVGR
jgi:hypothetical protein